MNKAQEFLESFNDFTKSDDEIRLRVNHRFGTRCPGCGLMLGKITALPAKRTCCGCGTAFNINRAGKGLLFKRIRTE